MTARRYAFVAGGGTAGHVMPAVSIARALVALGYDRTEIEMIGSRRGQESILLAEEGFPLTLLAGRGIARRLDARSLMANVGAVAGLAWATVRATAALASRRPRVVVSVGGYASFPACAAAVVLGVPLVLVNVDAVPGLVHRLMAPLAAASAVAFEGTRIARAVVTGTPVRAELEAVERSPAAAARARASLGLAPGCATVGVFGGSLGARRLNDAAVALTTAWAGRDDRSIYHVVGRRTWEARAGTGDDSGSTPGRPAYRAVPFLEQMALLYEAADVVVCRAGAITVAELSVAGVPAVLVPLPGAPRDHQTANARALVAAGGAVLLPDAECDGPRLAALLDELLGDPQRLASMSEALVRIGRRGAATRVAELVVAHAR